MVTNTEEDDDSQEDSINYKAKYRSFKRKLKFLIYENECFQEALRVNQRKMLKVSRDKSFLLDRMLNYEKVDVTSSEGDETESSDDEIGRADAKRRKVDMGLSAASSTLNLSSGATCAKSSTSAKKKKPPPKLKTSSSHPQLHPTPTPSIDGHMTSEEVERHLEGRQRFMEIDRAPVTIPTEMFSNDPSLDSESNEIGEMETSPSNLGEDCLNTDLILPD